VRAYELPPQTTAELMVIRGLVGGVWHRARRTWLDGRADLVCRPCSGYDDATPAKVLCSGDPARCDGLDPATRRAPLCAECEAGR
jgi:hypothetical protein